MKISDLKNKTILGILFVLPVIFLLFLYPSTNNYNPLEVVQLNVLELSKFTSESNEEIKLEGNITLLGFLGSDPESKALSALNLKELIYDKFKGFKKFQIIMIVPNGSENEVLQLEKELYQYDDLKYWHFVFGDEDEILKVFNSLNTDIDLDGNLGINNIFIVDKERNQRGRKDDRDKREKEKNSAVYPLLSYDCIEVAELKNKLASEDMRVLFTEYRQKRKGDFSTDTRREKDLKGNNEEI